MNDTANGRTALVIGATGGVGGAAAAALAKRGWRVVALNRDPDAAAARHAGSGFVWVQGDAMDPADVARAASGASVIFHGANPPGYRNWKGLVLPMLDSSLAAARAGGARLVLPGTVYNYGPDAGEVVAEDAPQNPATRKGAIRVEMERRIETSGVKALIVRAGDFFAPSAGNNWFAQGLVTPGRRLTALRYPGDPSIGHQWAYLPDLGETFAALLAREDELPLFARFHFGGHWLKPGGEMAEAIRRVAGRRDLPIRSLPWWLLRLIAPFNETLREMMEMRYLWRRPLRLANERLTEFLGREPHTTLDDAVRATLAGLKIPLE
ncbi:MAG: SDR family NAD(P)-dependent oxidoreductase [Micropepsaceae bacterium]